MDLKGFIVETITSIVEASQELVEQHSDAGVVINPPTSGVGDNRAFEVGSKGFTKRRVQEVEFDVALTVERSTSVGVDGEGKAKLWVASASGKVDADHSWSNQSVSRVRFTIPVALPASDDEKKNRSVQAPQVKVSPTVKPFAR